MSTFVRRQRTLCTFVVFVVFDGPKMAQDRSQKIIKKQRVFWDSMVCMVASAHFEALFLMLSLAAFLSSFASAAGRPQDGPKIAQDGPKLAPRWPQDGPKMAQDGPKMAQDGPRCSQDGPKDAPEGAKMATRAPRWPQEARRLPQEGPKNH